MKLAIFASLLASSLLVGACMMLHLSGKGETELCRMLMFHAAALISTFIALLIIHADRERPSKKKLS